MKSIKKADLLSKNLCGYNGQCPQYLSVSDGQKILAGNNLITDELFASRFTEIVENFGVLLLKGLEDASENLTIQNLEEYVKGVKLG